MDNSLLGAFFFCPSSLPSSCMLRPVHENTALHHGAGKTSSKTHGFLLPGNRISLFSPSLCAHPAVRPGEMSAKSSPWALLGVRTAQGQKKRLRKCGRCPVPVPAESPRL